MRMELLGGKERAVLLENNDRRYEQESVSRQFCIKLVPENRTGDRYKRQETVTATRT